MATLAELSILVELQSAYDAATDLDFQIAERDLTPSCEHEKPIGVIHDLEIRRLWVMARALEFKSYSIALAAKYGASDDAALNAAAIESLRLDALAHIVRDLFWIAAKTDLGAWSSESVGLRRGWMLAHTSSQQSLASALAALLRPAVE